MRDKNIAESLDQVDAKDGSVGGLRGYLYSIKSVSNNSAYWKSLASEFKGKLDDGSGLFDYDDMTRNMDDLKKEIEENQQKMEDALHQVLKNMTDTLDDLERVERERHTAAPKPSTSTLNRPTEDTRAKDSETVAKQVEGRTSLKPSDVRKSTKVAQAPGTKADPDWSEDDTREIGWKNMTEELAGLLTGNRNADAKLGALPAPMLADEDFLDEDEDLEDYPEMSGSRFSEEFKEILARAQKLKMGLNECAKAAEVVEKTADFMIRAAEVYEEIIGLYDEKSGTEKHGDILILTLRGLEALVTLSATKKVRLNRAVEFLERFGASGQNNTLSKLQMWLSELQDGGIVDGIYASENYGRDSGTAATGEGAEARPYDDIRDKWTLTRRYVKALNWDSLLDCLSKNWDSISKRTNTRLDIYFFKYVFDTIAKILGGMTLSGLVNSNFSKIKSDFYEPMNSVLKQTTPPQPLTKNNKDSKSSENKMTPEQELRMIQNLYKFAYFDELDIFIQSLLRYICGTKTDKLSNDEKKAVIVLSSLLRCPDIAGLEGYKYEYEIVRNAVLEVEQKMEEEDPYSDSKGKKIGYLAKYDQKNGPTKGIFLARLFGMFIHQNKNTIEHIDKEFIKNKVYLKKLSSNEFEGFTRKDDSVQYQSILEDANDLKKLLNDNVQLSDRKIADSIEFLENFIGYLERYKSSKITDILKDKSKLDEILEDISIDNDIRYAIMSFVKDKKFFDDGAGNYEKFLKLEG